MPLVPRKAEVSEIVSILESGQYDNADQMARAALKTAYQLLQERDWWVAGWQESTPREDGVKWNHLYGPYPSHSDALKSLKKGIGAGPDGSLRGVFKVNGIAPTQKHLDTMDDHADGGDPMCKCDHRKSNHSVPGAGPGCYAPRNVCECPKFDPA